MFIIFNKDKILSYLISISTVTILLVLSFAITKNNEEILKTSTNAVISNEIQEQNAIVSSNQVKDKSVTVNSNEVQGNKIKENVNETNTTINIINEAQKKVY